MEITVVERVFSFTNIIKNHMRNHMRDKWLNDYGAT